MSEGKPADTTAPASDADSTKSAEDAKPPEPKPTNEVRFSFLVIPERNGDSLTRQGKNRLFGLSEWMTGNPSDKPFEHVFYSGAPCTLEAAKLMLHLLHNSKTPSEAKDFCSRWVEAEELPKYPFPKLEDLKQDMRGQITAYRVLELWGAGLAVRERMTLAMKRIGQNVLLRHSTNTHVNILVAAHEQVAALAAPKPVEIVMPGHGDIIRYTLGYASRNGRRSDNGDAPTHDFVGPLTCERIPCPSIDD